MYGLRRARLAVAGAALVLFCAAAQAQSIEPVRIEGVGRQVTDLERSVAFYQLLGFSLDTGGIGTWHKDPVTAKLFGAPGIETRQAVLVTPSNVSFGRFVLVLTEIRGMARRDLSAHTPWEPGATHFGLVVPDAQGTWDLLRAKGLLHARSWGDALVAPPGQTRGMLAYMTDPDGLDIEIIDQRSNRPAGLSHVGLIILDADKARGFYETLLGGQLQSKEAPWLKGDFYDSAVGGHGNILRFFNLGFPEAAAPAARMNLELVEFQNRKSAVKSSRITDRGLGYLLLRVKDLDAVLAQAIKAGAVRVSGPTATEGNGTRAALIRDPDTGAFLLLRE